jgi:hypothetical protein
MPYFLDGSPTLRRYLGLVSARCRIMVAGAALTAAIAAVSAVYVMHRHAEQLALLPLIGSASYVERPTPIGKPASIEYAAGAHARTTGPIRDPYKKPIVTSRPDLDVTQAHSATAQVSPCRAAEGAWHLTAGGAPTLEAAGRARWIDGSAGRSEMISWLCHASGQIEIHFPTGPVRARQDTAGNQLTIDAPADGMVLCAQKPLAARRVSSLSRLEVRCSSARSMAPGAHVSAKPMSRSGSTT